MNKITEILTNKTDTNKRMLRKSVVAIVIICMLLAFPTISSYAGDGFLTPGASTTSGQQYDFTVNLADKVEEDETYTVSISVSPSPQSIAVHGVNASVNQVNKSISVTSGDLKGISAFSVTLYLGEVTEDTTYTVSASIAGTVSNVNDSFSFTAKAAESENTPVDDNNPDQEGREPQNKDESKNDGSSNKPDMNAADPGRNQGKSNQGISVSEKSGGNGVSNSSTVDSSLVYAGSSDNYLKSLSVSGYKFTQKFNKTRDTYFVNIPGETERLTVNAAACDSEANVCIAGNEDVSGKMSKIMINVTAENGSVRTYRIYVTHNSEE